MPRIECVEVLSTWLIVTTFLCWITVLSFVDQDSQKLLILLSGFFFPGILIFLLGYYSGITDARLQRDERWAPPSYGSITPTHV